MKLLIVTQKVNLQDDNLGFFHHWIDEFAKHCEEVVVIAGRTGTYDLPPNVKILSFRKSGRESPLRRLWTFWELFSKYYARSDAVFFHMIPEFVIAAAPFLLTNRKRSGLWYVHKSINWKTRLA